MNDLEKFRIKRRILRKMSTVIFDKIDEETTKDNISCCRKRLEQYMEQLLAKYKQISSLNAEIETKINVEFDLDAEILDSEKWREMFVDYKSKINITSKRLDSEVFKIQQSEPGLFTLNSEKPVTNELVLSKPQPINKELSISEPKPITKELSISEPKPTKKELKVVLERLNHPIHDEIYNGTAHRSYSPRMDEYGNFFVQQMENSFNVVNTQHEKYFKKPLDWTECDNTKITNNKIEDLVEVGVTSECLPDSASEGFTFSKGEFTQKTYPFRDKHPITKVEVKSTKQTSKEIPIKEVLKNTLGCIEIFQEKEPEHLSILPSIGVPVDESTLRANSKSKVTMNPRKKPRTKEKQTESDLMLPLGLEEHNEENFNSQAAKIMDLLNYLDNLNKADCPTTKSPSRSPLSMNQDSEKEKIRDNKRKCENITKENKSTAIFENNNSIEIIDLESNEETISSGSIINTTLNSRDPIQPNKVITSNLKIASASTVTLAHQPPGSEKIKFISSQPLANVNTHKSVENNKSMVTLELPETPLSASMVTIPSSLTPRTKRTVTLASTHAKTTESMLLSTLGISNDLNYQKSLSPRKNVSGVIELISPKGKTMGNNFISEDTDDIEIIELGSDEETLAGSHIKSNPQNSDTTNPAINPRLKKALARNLHNVDEKNMSKALFSASTLASLQPSSQAIQIIPSQRLSNTQSWSQTPNSMNISSLATSPGNTVAFPSFCATSTNSMSLRASSHAERSKGTYTILSIPDPCSESSVALAPFPLSSSGSIAPSSLQLPNWPGALRLNHNTTSFQLKNDPASHIPSLAKISNTPVSSCVITNPIKNCVSSQSTSSYTIGYHNAMNFPLSEEITPLNNLSTQLNRNSSYEASKASANLSQAPLLAGNLPCVTAPVRPIFAINKPRSQNALYINASNTSQVPFVVQSSGLSFVSQPVEISIVAKTSGYVLTPQTSHR